MHRNNDNNDNNDHISIANISSNSSSSSSSFDTIYYNITEEYEGNYLERNYNNNNFQTGGKVVDKVPSTRNETSIARSYESSSAPSVTVIKTVR